MGTLFNQRPREDRFWNDLGDEGGGTHPLAEFTLRAFEEQNYQDVSSLAYRLAGGLITKKHGSFVLHRKANEAYRLVAEDVLGCLENDGTLTRDRLGWYVLRREAGGEQ